MNSETIKGALDRAALIVVTWALTWATSRGYLSTSDAAQLTPALVVLVGFVIAYIVNRPSSLAAAASRSDRQTVVITKPEIAEDGPDKVISNTCPPSVIASAIKDAKASA